MRSLKPSDGGDDGIKYLLDIFRAEVEKRASLWETMMDARKKEFERLEAQEVNLTIEIRNLNEKIVTMLEGISYTDSHRGRAEAQDPSAINDYLTSMMRQMEEKYVSDLPLYPRCSRCHEICTPLRDKAAYCCPARHYICRPCTGQVAMCPTCRLDKSSFGGAFQEYEQTVGRVIDDFVGAAGIVSDVLSPVEFRQIIMDNCDQIRNVVMQQVEASRLLLEIREGELDELQMAQEAMSNGRSNFIQSLKDHRVHLDEITKHISDVHGTGPDLSAYEDGFRCHCELACPHLLKIDDDNVSLIRDKNCKCCKKKRCRCITHSITIDFKIEGGSYGAVTILLAGRNRPVTVNNIFVAARTGYLEGYILSHVEKGDCMVFGYDKKQRNDLIRPVDRRVVRRRPFKVRPYTIGGFVDRTSFKIYKGPRSRYKFSSFGKVIRGQKFLDVVFQLPTRMNMPIQQVVALRAYGKFVFDKIHL